MSTFRTPPLPVLRGDRQRGPNLPHHGAVSNHSRIHLLTYSPTHLLTCSRPYFLTSSHGAAYLIGLLHDDGRAADALVRRTRRGALLYLLRVVVAYYHLGPVDLLPYRNPT
eukprot:scaffold16405_cov29-Phaeocystis_antarctica.AAC.1